MDLAVVKRLEEAGIDKTQPMQLGIVLDGQERIQPVDDSVVVVSTDSKNALVTLKKISELFAGTKVPPRFRGSPSDEYIPFFSLIEFSVVQFCECAERPEYDTELERLYTHLRRRPDGRDANVLFSYMQAAARLYMSLFDVSQAEFDAVCRRLSQSASHFREGPTSVNYCKIVSAALLEG